MTLQKLNIPPKTDNAAKKKMVQSNAIGANETLLASEVNSIVNTTNNLVDAVNNFNKIDAFNFKGNVATYANLPTTNLVKDDAYGVITDGLIYIYNGTSFPPSGNGLNLGLKPVGEVKAGDALAVSGDKVFSTLKKPLENSGFEFVENYNYVSKNDADYDIGYTLRENGVISVSSSRRVNKDYISLTKGIYETNISLANLIYLCIFDENFNVKSTHTNKSGVWTFEITEDFAYLKYTVLNSLVNSTYIHKVGTDSEVKITTDDSNIVDKDFLNRFSIKNNLILNNINDFGDFNGAFRWIVGANVVEQSVVNGNLVFKGVGDLRNTANIFYRAFSSLPNANDKLLVSFVAKSSNNAILYYGRGANIGVIKEVQLTTEFVRYTSILDFTESRIKFAGSLDGVIEIESITIVNLTQDLGNFQINNELYFHEILNKTGYFEKSKIITENVSRYATHKEIEKLNYKPTDVGISIDFTANSNVNLRIEEFYLLEDYEDYKITRVYAQSNRIRVFITKISTNELIVLCNYDNVDLNIYGKVLTLYLNNSPVILGYIVLKFYETDYLLDSNITLKSSVNEIKNSPKIQELLNRQENLIFLSDSIFGFKSGQNVLKEFLNTKIKARVFNTGMGGCRMSWRNVDGSHNYDAFSGVSIADALVTQDFSNQIAKNTTLSNDFTDRLADLMNVDLAKPTTIFLSYVNNDITGNVPIGQLWDSTTPIENYDKTTFLGAMNYVVRRLSTAYTHIKWVVFGEVWRMKNDKNSISVPPYAYINNIDVQGTTYSDKMRENAIRMGLSYFDLLENGVNNPYNATLYLQDASHFNYNGFVEFSEKLKFVYESYKR